MGKMMMLRKQLVVVLENVISKKRKSEFEIKYVIYNVFRLV